MARAGRRLWQNSRAAGGGGMSTKEDAVKGNKRSIVSSAHLVSERAAETSAFEYGLYIASNAFNRWIVRSEEHTSELQSLMRISYAVFCLKNKNYTDQHNKHIQRKLR